MKISTKTMVSVGMFAAVLSVLSVLTIPMPSGVPLTLQTFAMALCGYALGAKRGTAAVALYLLLGAVGMPVFAGMTGGVSRFVGPTGGFLWGFLFLAALCGFAKEQKSLAVRILFSLLGLALCHLLGVVQYSVVAATTPAAAFFTVSLPYLLKDILSAAGAYAVALPLQRALRGERAAA